MREISVPWGTPLYLVTGRLDDERKVLTPELPERTVAAQHGDTAAWLKSCERTIARYRTAIYAYSKQSVWSPEEQGEYWFAHLGHWPRRGNKVRNQEAMAFGVARAINMGFSESKAVDMAGRSREQVVNDKVPELAKRMIGDLARGPGAGWRVPRVVTKEEFDRRPLVGSFDTVSHYAELSGYPPEPITGGALSFETAFEGMAALSNALDRREGNGRTTAVRFEKSQRRSREF